MDGESAGLQMWCLSTKCILILYKPVFSPKETYGLVPRLSRVVILNMQHFISDDHM